MAKRSTKKTDSENASESVTTEDIQLSLADKKRMLNVAKATLQKKWGSEVFCSNEAKNLPYVPTGSALLDEAIGIGGMPLGRVVEIFGANSGGKTTLCTSIMSQAQQIYPDKMVSLIDVENAYNVQYAQSLGLDLHEDKFVFSQPNSAEEALDVLIRLCETGLFSVIVLDSVAALRTQRQINGEVGDATIGLLAKLLSENLSDIAKHANRTNTLVIFINQTRSKIVMMGNPETTSGGNALPFYCSVRLRVKKIKPILGKDDNPIGQTISIDVLKNKVGIPFRVVETSIIFGKGFDTFSETVEVAKRLDIIKQGGAWFFVKNNNNEELKFQGFNKVLEYFETDKEAFEKLKSDIKDKLLAPKNNIIDDIDEKDSSIQNIETENGYELND